jgi:cytidine deaminase
MENLVDNLFKKRFGLSKNSDTNNCKLNCCLCGTQFYHIACCIKGNLFSGKIQVLSFGENKYNPSTNINSVKSSIHAEQNAINKLPYIRKQIKINMIVLRFTKKNTLSMSKPCNKCIYYMNSIFPKKGYIIKDIYYSTGDNKIIKTNLTNLCKEVDTSSNSSNNETNI